MRRIPIPARLLVLLLGVVILCGEVPADTSDDAAAGGPAAAVEDAPARRDPMRFLRDAPKPEPVEPVDPAAIEQAITRGVDFLIETQNPDGSWGRPTRTKGLNLFAPVPGGHHAFQLATTSLAVWSLIEAADTRPEAVAALERGEAHLLEQLPELRRSAPNALYNVWGHAYGIQALVRMRSRLPDDAPRIERIDDVIRQQIDMLDRFEVADGGWGYYDFTYRAQRPGGSSLGFTSATVLIALHEAAEVGIEMPERTINRAVESIIRQRKPDFTYIYGEYLQSRPMMDINRPEGSLSRSQVCNLALRLWGDEAVTDEIVIAWLDWLYASDDWMSIARKRPIPHEAWYQISGYFYYYGHLYAAMLFEHLPEEPRQRFQQHEATTLLQLQETDGSWWDYPLFDYHQQYGTAMALISLARCR